MYRMGETQHFLSNIRYSKGVRGLPEHAIFFFFFFFFSSEAICAVFHTNITEQGQTVYIQSVHSSNMHLSPHRR